MSAPAPVTFVMRMRIQFKPVCRLLALTVVLSASMEPSARVLQHLEQSERTEIDAWYRDDIRIAWLTTLEASRGNQQPHVDAVYRVLGCHPDQVFERITARRKAMLGAAYADFFPEASSPKKPCASTREENTAFNARAKTDRAS